MRHENKLILQVMLLAGTAGAVATAAGLLVASLFVAVPLGKGLLIAALAGLVIGIVVTVRAAPAITAIIQGEMK